MLSLAGSSHSFHFAAGSITGMRSCTGVMVPLAAVVMMVQLCSHGASGPAVLSRHVVHRPATASGSPSSRWMNIGCLLGLPDLVSAAPSLPCCHQKKPSMGMITRCFLNTDLNTDFSVIVSARALIIFEPILVSFAHTGTRPQ